MGVVRGDLTVRSTFLALLLLASSGLLVGGTETQVSERGSPRDRGPLSPDQALASFELEPGYRIELAASEPLIRDPVAMAFDHRGRMYVAESRGYPGPLEGAPASPPEGVIALLEDTDHDGRFDKRTDFARNLTFPNGILPWDGGVFVTCAPDLLYLKDTTGDGVADERRVVLTGFDATKTAQLRFSHPTLGLDNWIYLTSGLTGGRVTAPDQPDRQPVVFGNSDSRFNPITQAFELTGGQSQYGLTFDDQGHRFTCSNRRPVMQVVLESRYLQRNPHLAFSQTVEDVSAAGSQAVVWPLSGDTTTASFIPGLMSAPHAGTFTAASGVHIHRGDALPAEHRESLFICESAQNLVQRQVRSPNGVTFTSKPARTGHDFLSSRDTWFRPVFAANGPDGALYIVDMYRKIIDHPQYVPEQSRALLDFEAGKERGRIYRVVASGWKRDRAAIDLGRMTAAELTRTLEHPNAWWRETAQRLLLERQDRGAVPLLRTLARNSRREVVRIHALWTLDALGGLETADLLAALSDRDSGVRENAVRLSEGSAAESGGRNPESRAPSPDPSTLLRVGPEHGRRAEPRLSREMLSRLLAMVDDTDDRVRLRVALALGEADDSSVVTGLAALARRDGAQTWLRAAILSSVKGRSNEFLRAFTNSPSPPDVKAAVMQDLGQIFGAGQSPERCLDLIVQLGEPGADSGWQPAAIAGVAQGLKARGLGKDRSPLMTLLSGDSEQARLARQRVDAIVSRTSAIALDDNAPLNQRVAGIALLGHTDYITAGRTLQSLIAPRQSSEIQVAAVRALLQLRDRAGTTSLLERARWQAFTPQVREAVISILLSDDAQTTILLDVIEQGSIDGAALAPSRRSRLMTHRDAVIQKRARVLLAGVESGDRMLVYDRLRGAVLGRGPNVPSGKNVFAAHCASCHAIDGTGGQVGPDLSGIRNQPADAILLHVVVPDYDIAAGYQSYVVQTRDGRTLVGRLEAEAPNSVTLRDGAAQAHVILRSDIISMSASIRSLMPAELERAMSEQDLADLIGYLKADSLVR
jgi:putative membrane-bound dehydrogenase-like protein